MGQEETGCLPDLGDQGIQVVRGGRATERLDGLLRGRLGEQAVFGVVDEFAFLTFLDGLDGQAQLLGDLVVRAGVQVRDPGVDIQQG